jgi:hypothetical protein
MLRLSSRVACLTLSLFIEACMVYPYDGQTFLDVDSSVVFSGCSTSPGAIIEIQARNPLSLGFPPTGETIETVRASNIAATDVTGREGFCWVKAVIIKPELWFGLGEPRPPLPNFFPEPGEPIPESPGPIRLLEPPPFTTHVRAIDHALGGPTWTYNNDPERCPEPAGTPQLTNQEPCALAPTELNGGFVTIRALRGPSGGLP